MRNHVFFGTGVAVATPFCLSGEVDYNAFEALVLRLLKANIKAIVVGGTTGEGSSLSFDEKNKLIKIAKQNASGKAAVIAGVSANIAESAIKQCILAEAAGADAVLVTTPYYNRCSQTGILRYFGDICAQTHLPIIVYDVPCRTGMEIKATTYGKLFSLKQIVGIKECSGNLVKTSALINEFGFDVCIYSGDDDLNLPIYAVGGHGCISVSANILPRAVAACYESYKNQHTNLAARYHWYLEKMNRAMFCENNPIPVKYALHKMGLIENIYRSPLTPPDKENAEQIECTLKEYGLIK